MLLIIFIAAMWVTVVPESYSTCSINSCVTQLNEPHMLEYRRRWYMNEVSEWIRRLFWKEQLPSAQFAPFTEFWSRDSWEARRTFRLAEPFRRKLESHRADQSFGCFPLSYHVYIWISAHDSWMSWPPCFICLMDIANLDVSIASNLMCTKPGHHRISQPSFLSSLIRKPLLVLHSYTCQLIISTSPSLVCF